MSFSARRRGALADRNRRSASTCQARTRAGQRSFSRAEGTRDRITPRAARLCNMRRADPAAQRRGIGTSMSDRCDTRALSASACRQLFLDAIPPRATWPGAGLQGQDPMVGGKSRPTSRRNLQKRKARAANSILAILSSRRPGPKLGAVALREQTGVGQRPATIRPMPANRCRDSVSGAVACPPFFAVAALKDHKRPWHLSCQPGFSFESWSRHEGKDGMGITCWRGRWLRRRCGLGRHGLRCRNCDSSNNGNSYGRRSTIPAVVIGN